MKFEFETWEYLEELEELEEIIAEVEYCDYVHNEEAYYDEITEVDLKTFQGYYWE